MGEGDSLHTAAFVQNAFYQYSVPGWVSEHFCLPQATAAEMQLDAWAGCSLDPDSLLFPLVAAAPMGWSWAMS